MQGLINRTITKKVKEISKNYPVVMITGPRQVGKTTLLKFIMRRRKNKLCFTRWINNKSTCNRRSRTILKNIWNTINNRWVSICTRIVNIYKNNSRWKKI